MKTDAARANSPRALLAFQRVLKDAITLPLTADSRTQRRDAKGRLTAKLAARFIKPNDRLTSLERLEIYNRMYWFRILDCFYDDNPGLRAALGERRFLRLAEAYLTKNPSRSFTLRNLCDRLERFIRAEPRWTTPSTALATEITRFEWAQTVAFDEATRPVLSAVDFAGTSPSHLRLRLQPYVSLLALNFPVDDYVTAVKQRDVLRAEASNATTSQRRKLPAKKVPLPHRERVHLAVHRIDNRIFYKRLEPAAWRILCALRDGTPLTRAIFAGGRSVQPEQVRDWFALWTELGWFCRRK